MFDNTYLREIASRILLNGFRRKWRKINRHNGTVPMNRFSLDLVQVGEKSYGELNIVTFNNNTRVKIGSYCSIAQNVIFLLDVEHNIKTISTYPFKAKCLNNGNEAFSKGDIIVEDDVWLGYGVTIMSGVHIGQGAVIAAGAVVTKDVPPYAIVGGVPAKLIKYRYEPKLITKLLKVDYSKLTDEMVKNHIDELYDDLKNEEQLEWMPQKVHYYNS